MRILFTLLFLSISLLLTAQEEKQKPFTHPVEFKYGGYVKTDFMYTNYKNGSVNKNSIIRDFLFPPQIPVGPEEHFHDTYFHAKESRFNFDITSEILGKEIHSFLEMDFMVSSQGNENVSNSYSPRIRHFYFEWGNLLVGQTWSNFMIVVLPNDIDFTGAPEGLVFIRQALIRYKYKNWSFALENPTSLTTTDEVTNLQSKSGYIPALTVQKKFPLKKRGYVAVSGILRTIVSNYPDKARNAGFGISTGGLIKIGNTKDDLRFMGTYGTGLGRYIAFGTLAGAYFNGSELENIQSINGYIAYNHFWTNKLSSSINISGLHGFNPDNINPLANKIVYSASINLKYEPVTSLMFGAEYNFARREIENGTSGSFNRIQLAAVYKFGYHNFETAEKYIK